MPSALESLAALIHDPAFTRHAAARVDSLRLHVADTLGMILQGQSLAEGTAAMALGLPRPKRNSHKKAQKSQSDFSFVTFVPFCGYFAQMLRPVLKGGFCVLHFADWISSSFLDSLAAAGLWLAVKNAFARR